jgi:hypothetical protein
MCGLKSFKNTILKKVINVFILLYILSCNNSTKHEKSVTHEGTVIKLPANAIPFIFRSGIIIKIKVNDSITGNFQFDSGSDQLYLDSTFVADNNIPLNNIKKKQIRGVGSDTPLVPIVEDLKLRLDTLVKVYENVPVTNIRLITHNKGEIDGIFGTDFFKNYILKINFDSSYIQLIKQSEFKAPNGYKSLKLFITENKTFVKCNAIITDSINVDGFAMLDLGSSYGLTLTNVIAEHYDLKNKIKNKYAFTHKNTGYGRISHSFFFRAESLNIGNFIIAKPVMNYSIDSKGALSFGGIVGLLGIKVIERFNLFFDFPGKKLYLKPNSKFKEYFYSDMTGFSGSISKAVNFEGYIVEYVIENSPAQIAGIKDGDIITDLNGLKISSYSEIERRKLFNQDTLELNLIILRHGTTFKTKLLPKEMI